MVGLARPSTARRSAAASAKAAAEARPQALCSRGMRIARIMDKHTEDVRTRPVPGIGGPGAPRRRQRKGGTSSVFSTLASQSRNSDEVVFSLGHSLRVKACQRACAAMTVTALVLGAGCSSGPRSHPDLAAARNFTAFPLYWVGPRFEKWDLVTVQGLQAPRAFVSFIYGECTPSGGEQPSCAPPFEIQVSRLCSHLDVVASDPAWRTRHVRGAPVGRNPDGAPVLFSRRAQVKVYRGQGSDSELPLRVLRALRSINDVPPVIAPGEGVPGPAPGVLEGARSCR